VSSIEGTGDESITVTATGNTLSSARTAELSVIGEGITRTIQVTQAGAIGINNIENNFKIYPNPAKKEFYIELSGINSMIEIYSIDGEKIIVINTSEKLIRLNSEGISKGMYFVKVSDKSGTKVKKLLIN